MRILAIDTALAACAAAIYDTDAPLLTFESLAIERGHAEALMPLIARVVDKAGVEFSALDRIAVTVGPGSFTGLRVGIAAARGIALATGKPAIGLSTLAAYAAPLIERNESCAIVSVIDARHGHVYLQIFGIGGQTLMPPRYAAIDEAIRAATTRPVRIVGSGADLLASHWPPHAAAPLGVRCEPAPSIEWVARLGAAATLDGAPPKPLYLRSPDAKPQDAARLPRR